MAMIERLAAALIAENDKATLDCEIDWNGLARAAIEAMRESTEAMLTEGNRGGDQSVPRTHSATQGGGGRQTAQDES
jgi:hypothetical protein